MSEPEKTTRAARSSRDYPPLTTPEQHALVELWMPFAYQLAGKHFHHQTGQRRTEHLLEELQAEALLALCYAASIYDPHRGYSFSTLAYTCIRNRLALNAYHARRHRQIRREPLFEDSLRAPEERDPLFVARDQIEEVKRHCSPFQRLVLADLLVADGNMSECGRLRGVTSSAVQEQIRRLRETLAERGKGIA